jgi:hypothetical protein
VSPGDDFYVLLFSNNSRKHTMILIQSEEEDMSFLCRIQESENSLSGSTKKFYLKNKSNLTKYNIFENVNVQEMEESFFGQLYHFSTSEKQIKDVFFDEVYNGLFYVQFSDNSLEGYVIIREFDNQTRIQRINEINQNNQQENIMLKIDNNLEIMGINKGQLSIYDRRNNDDTDLFQKNLELPNEILFSTFENQEIVFSVAGPGFDSFQQQVEEKETE